jgi:hypothetical protein
MMILKLLTDPRGKVVMRVSSDKHDGLNMCMAWNAQTKLMAESSVAHGFAQWAPQNEQGNAYY